MVIDTQFSANRFYEDQQRRGLHQYKPTDVGLPTYLDEFCQAASNCMLPTINIAGYQGVSTNADGGLETTNLQAQSSVTNVMGKHTLRGGVDYRLAMRRAGLMTAGNVSSTYNFDNLYTRAADTTSVFPASNIGLGLAALMLGIPTSVSIGQNAPISMTNPYYGVFVQDTWRAASNLTLNFGLRFEYEGGIKESEDRWLTEFDPAAGLAITDLAQAAYARNPIPQVPVSEFRVLGGSVYATAPGAMGLSWKGESMWMPRVSGAYTLGERTVIKGGYGLFYDTLNAGDYTGFNQLGYSSATTNVSSTDFGRSWLLGDPVNGVSPLVDPFPVRVGGGRFEEPIEDALGVDAILGTNFTREDPNRRHPRVQRWRIGVQREVVRNLAVEVAYTGSYADRVGRNIAESYVPEQYYSSVTNVRDATQQSLLQQQVPNPFNIANFASLATTNPTLYQRMAGNSFFTATTMQRQNLLRGYPQLSGLSYANLPLGVVKDHALEITLTRRYSAGLSANVAFAARRVTENRTVETYDREPTLWQTSQNARPWRLSGGAVYEFPFGRTKPFLNDGGVAAALLGGWQTGATFEYQPGALLDWGNLFFNGDLSAHRQGQAGDRAAARRHDRPDQDLDQHRRGLRAGCGPAAGGVPEARLPVPHRRRARAGHVPGQRQHRPQLRPRRPAAAPGPDGRAEPVRRRAVGQPQPRSDQHQLRQDHDGDQQHHAVLHVRGEVQFLEGVNSQLPTTNSQGESLRRELALGVGSLERWELSPASLHARDLPVRDAALHGAAADREDSAAGPRRQSRGLEHLHGLLPGRAPARISLRARAEQPRRAALAVAGARRRAPWPPASCCRCRLTSGSPAGPIRGGGRCGFWPRPSACRSSRSRRLRRCCSTGFRGRAIPGRGIPISSMPRATPAACWGCSAICWSSRSRRGALRRLGGRLGSGPSRRWSRRVLTQAATFRLKPEATLASHSRKPHCREARAGSHSARGKETGSGSLQPEGCRCRRGWSRAPHDFLATRALWMVLALVPSALLLGVTQHLATDVVSAPLLWVVPLALYLATFIAVFSGRGFGTARRWGAVAPVAALPCWSSRWRRCATRSCSSRWCISRPSRCWRCCATRVSPRVARMRRI